MSRVRRFEVNALIRVLLTLQIFTPAWTRPVSLPRLHIVILEAEAGTGDIEGQDLEALVRVEDENRQPLASVAVTFALTASGPSGMFANASRIVTVLTDNNGQALMPERRPNGKTGDLKIKVTASHLGQTATAIITQSNKNIRYLIFPEPKRRTNVESRITVRAFLGDESKEENFGFVPLPFRIVTHEDNGYGLYSYVLFPFPPTDLTLDLYRQVITIYLEKFLDVEDYLPLFQKQRLDVTYLLLSPKQPHAGPESWLNWILDNYDYPRARKLLLIRLFQQTARDGPRPREGAQDVGVRGA